MTADDHALLAEKAAVVERHSVRVAEKLPTRPGDLLPSSDASDAVILHLWQATQVVIDLAVSTCVRRKLGTPSTYADAFRSLATAGLLDGEMADRLTKAAGFRNLVAHAYQSLDMARIHRAACEGPADLRAFVAALRDGG
ncbi:MAG: DUF86 domain-containing protein [Myxococcales bacterium]|nr:DUF86 domain-containing protein [Myxococcales bacterium]